MPGRALLDIEALQQEFETAHPQNVLQWAAQTFGQKLAIVTSFQPTGIVTMHMMSQIAPDTPVLTLDTGVLFDETYQLMDELEAQLKLNLIRVKPALTLDEQAEQHGATLWDRDPEKCCQIRKVTPLNEVLVGYDAWISGIRRDQSSGRAFTPIIARDARQEGRVKLNPFATWTEEMIWTYIRAYELPYNTLHDNGYPSIGCKTCTRPVTDGVYSRDGRWSGFGKVECGIHVDPAPATVAVPVREINS